MKRRNSHFGAYIVLNVLISAITTLGILYAWETFRPSRLPEGAQAILAAEQATRESGEGGSSGAWQAAPTATLPSAAPEGGADLEPVIAIDRVVGAGDLNQEYVLLKRQGESDLNLSGWRLHSPRGEDYNFPDLVLYKEGAVQVYSRPGSDTATFLFWNRSASAWMPGDEVTLVDPQGHVRAKYTVP